MRTSLISRAHRSVAVLQLVLLSAALIILSSSSTRGMPALTPTLILIAPNFGQRGHSALDVEITGQDTHFSHKTTASFGTGITVNTVTVVSSTFAVVNITIASGATLGNRTVSLTGSGEVATLANGFAVTAVPTISISNATVIEGNSLLGPPAVFAVTLSQAASLPVSVNYTTADSSAIDNTTIFTFATSGLSIPSVGPASPYPLTIPVGAFSGVVTRVRVALTTYTHTWPGDVDILLQGPGGQTVVLMSDVGENGVSVSSLILTFDDLATSFLPATPISGTFKPTNYSGSGEVSDTFPAPAPAGPYGDSLAVFNGLSPTGTWKLFVVDDTGEDSGSFSAWNLHLTTSLGDYVGQAGTLTFPPGVTRMTVAVPTRGDTTSEANESFSVNLSAPVNATIADATGTATILNDDPPSLPPPGSGAADVVLDLGAAGVWGRYNNSTWSFINGADASVVATADIDGNRQSDVIANFPGQGVWAKLNGLTWKQIHPMDAIAIAAGDLDGNGKSDLVLNFGAAGVWVYSNDSTFFQINTGNPASLLTGDLDGDGSAEVIMNFTLGGIYQWNYASGTTLIHTMAAGSMAIGNLDGVGGEELLIGFPGFGLYFLRGGTFTFLHPLVPSLMVLADIDNNGQADLIADFPTFGVYSYKSQTAAWSQIHPSDVLLLAAGDIDNSGRADVLMSFTQSGFWAWMNDTSFSFVNAALPQGVAVGKLD